jgi:hypothetical protein
MIEYVQAGEVVKVDARRRKSALTVASSPRQKSLAMWPFRGALLLPDLDAFRCCRLSLWH